VASGTIAATSSASGNVTRVLLTLGASGTVTATSGSTGDPTRVPLTLGASGTVTATSGVQGDPARLGPIVVWSVSGATGAVSGTTGYAERVSVFSVSGTVTVHAWLKLDATRVPLVFAASGTAGAVSGTFGGSAKPGFIRQATGTAIAVSMMEAAPRIALPSTGWWGLSRVGV
jgi:hypothetical protein